MRPERWKIQEGWCQLTVSMLRTGRQEHRSPCFTGHPQLHGKFRVGVGCMNPIKWEKKEGRKKPRKKEKEEKEEPTKEIIGTCERKGTPRQSLVEIFSQLRIRKVELEC